MFALNFLRKCSSYFILSFMKKILFCALSGLVFTANAQNVYQVQNSNFEEWETVTFSSYKGDEPLHWNSFLTGTGKWINTAGRNQVEKSTEVRPGSTGKQSVKIFDRNVMLGIIAQGNLTTGCINMGSMTATDESGNYNYTKTDDDNLNQRFTGRPDAMVVWVKFVARGSNKAKVNTILHTDGYYQDPEGNTITATVIAKAENTSIVPSNDWQKLTIPFDYKNEGRPAYALVSFASNNTPGKGAVGNYMLIDDLEYIYNYSLTSATYGATSLTVPAAGETADCGTLTYDESTELTLTTDGEGASVEKAYDAESCVLTVTVKADDYEVSKHSNVYKFQFAQPAASVPSLASLKISGENFVLTEDVTEYELPYVYNKGIVFEPVADEESTLGDVVYNDEDKTVSITVTNDKDKETVYVFRFGQLDETAAESGDYNGALSVVLITPDATSNGLLENAAIALSKNASGTYNLTLNNFAFMGMTVGDIFVPNITLTDGKLEAQRTIMITSDDESAMGPMLGALPVKVSAILVDTDKKAAAASIDILTSETDLSALFQGIHVDFVPYEVEGVGVDGAEWGGPQHYENVKVSGRVTKETAKFLHINNKYTNSMGETEEYPMTYIDLTGATVDADVTYADIMTGAPEKNNTLVYLPENSKLTDANTVVSGKATTLALTEKVALYVPVAFTAGSISFDRTFNTEEGKVSSFVMPFELKADNVEGKLYTFKGINGENAEFKKLENTETLAANTPCLIVAENAHPFDGVKNVSVAATEGEMTNTVGNASHIGTYTTQTVTSDATATYYGYQNGEFVKANNGTLNPFRTMIKVTGTVTAQALKLKLNDETTGISEATNEAGKADVYTLDGKCVRRGVAAKEALNGLGKGVYVVNGRKIVK